MGFIAIVCYYLSMRPRKTLTKTGFLCRCSMGWRFNRERCRSLGPPVECLGLGHVQSLLCKIPIPIAWLLLAVIT